MQVRRVDHRIMTRFYFRTDDGACYGILSINHNRRNRAIRFLIESLHLSGSGSVPSLRFRFGSDRMEGSLVDLHVGACHTCIARGRVFREIRNMVKAVVKGEPVEGLLDKFVDVWPELAPTVAKCYLGT